LLYSFLPPVNIAYFITFCRFLQGLFGTGQKSFTHGRFGTGQKSFIHGRFGPVPKNPQKNKQKF